VGFSFSSANGVQIIQGGVVLPTVGSWQVAPDTDWITMSASWDNPQATPPAVIVTYRLSEDTPILATYTEDQFAAHKISIVADRSDATHETVSVADPIAGVWNVLVVDPSGLGHVSYEGRGAAPAITADWTNVTRSGGAVPQLAVSLDVHNAPDGVLVDIY